MPGTGVCQRAIRQGIGRAVDGYARCAATDLARPGVFGGCANAVQLKLQDLLSVRGDCVPPDVNVDRDTQDCSSALDVQIVLGSSTTTTTLP